MRAERIRRESCPGRVKKALREGRVLRCKWEPGEDGMECRRCGVARVDPTTEPRTGHRPVPLWPLAAAMLAVTWWTASTDSPVASTVAGVVLVLATLLWKAAAR